MSNIGDFTTLSNSSGIYDHYNYYRYPTSSEYLEYKKNQVMCRLEVVSDILGLDLEEYKSILNLIMSKDESSINIAEQMLKNIHKNYNISKK